MPSRYEIWDSEENYIRHMIAAMGDLPGARGWREAMRCKEREEIWRKRSIDWSYRYTKALCSAFVAAYQRDEAIRRAGRLEALVIAGFGLCGVMAGGLLLYFIH